MERGERRPDVWELIFGNVRLDIVADDVDAMIGACTVGEREMKALLASYGVEAYRGAVGRCSTRPSGARRRRSGGSTTAPTAPS